METVELFGLPLTPLTLPEVVDRCRQAVATRTPVTIAGVDALRAVEAQRDDDLRADLLGMDVLLAEDQTMVWAAKLLGVSIPERHTVVELFESIVGLGEQDGYSVYFLGATPKVVRKTVDEVRRTHPRLRIAGFRDGYFSDDEAAGVAADIAATSPDLVFLGMATPKRERFARRFGHDLGACVVLGVGGAFDVAAGTHRRAPVRVADVGLEWVGRMMRDPRSFGPRYAKANGEFLLLLEKAKREAAHRAKADAAAAQRPPEE